ncbi:unnamed protein product [Rhizophagus irregularis]|nr:unnamed protein product [Rhizophagus irregularis]
MSVELLTHFSQNFSRYFDSTDESNVVIRVGKDDNTQNFKAHSLILKAQCPYFNAGLSSEWAKKEGNNIIFDKPNIEPEVFEIVLKYLYTGIITSIESQSPSFVIQLLCAADELILPEMISYVEDQFLLHHSSYLNENFSEILNIAFKHDVYEEVLWKYVNPKNVIFVNKREKEIQQEETLNFNARNNDKESSFPYLINYRNSLQPSRPSPIDSSIINLKHAALISSWVDRLSHPYRLASIPYQFRVKGTKEIFGGYNPLNWNGSGYKSTSESFIFSFEVTLIVDLNGAEMI